MANEYTGFPINLLKEREAVEPNSLVEQTKSKLIQLVSDYFNVQAEVTDAVVGPTVTRYELKLPADFSVIKVEILKNEILDELAPTDCVRMDISKREQNIIGVEIPNPMRAVVPLREALCHPDFINHKSPLALPVGKDADGNIIVDDLSKLPHLLIAGQSGSGKTVFIQSTLASIMYKSSPDDVRFVIVGRHAAEINVFNGMPHMLFEKVLTMPHEVYRMLKWVSDEMNRRYSLLSQTHSMNITDYNNLPKVTQSERLARIVIVIDDFSFLASSQLWDDISSQLIGLAALSRAAGIHIIMSSLYVGPNVITGMIKANLPSRIAFRVPNSMDSRVILDMPGAESLVGNGDMLYFPVYESGPKRVQGAYISFREFKAIINYIKEHNESSFNKSIAESVFGKEEEKDESIIYQDSLTKKVLAFGIEYSRLSPGIIQRRFSIGYARASRIIDGLEQLGYISHIDYTNRTHKTLITLEQYKKLFGETDDE